MADIAYDLVGKIIDYERGALDSAEITKLFQRLIDTGIAWQLHGAYGRKAAAMIESGRCRTTA